MPDPDSSVPARRDPLAALRRPSTVAERCAAVSEAVADGRSGHFKLDLAALPTLVKRLRDAAPAPGDADTPRGDRWAALRAGGRDRAAEVLARVADPADSGEVARQARLDSAFDLATLLVLLDSQAAQAWFHDEPAAGAPAAGVDRLALPVEQHASEDLFAMLDRFTPGATQGPTAAPAAPRDGLQPEGDASPPGTDGPTDAPLRPSAEPAAPAPTPAPTPATAPTPSMAGAAGTRWAGSTALSIAVARAFMSGVFSATGARPAQADAGALRRVEPASLRAALQVTASNRLPGLDACAVALSRLGQRLGEEGAREGGLARPARWIREAIDRARDPADPMRLHAAVMAAWLTRRLAEATPGGHSVLGLPAGEVASHLWAGKMAGADDLGTGLPVADAGTGSWVPFHSRAMGLVRTLREPLADAGYTLAGLDTLPDAGTARHVGLLLESGLLVARSPAWLARPRPPGDEAVVEARAMAITWLPRAAAVARADRLAAGEVDAPRLDVLIEWAAAAAGSSGLRVDGESGAW